MTRYSIRVSIEATSVEDALGALEEIIETSDPLTENFGGRNALIETMTTKVVQEWS